MMLIRGWASLFGVKDKTGDVVMPGAFTRTLGAGEPVGMLLAHQAAAIIGFWTLIEERDRGLWVEGEIIEAVRDGEESATLVRRGALRCLSIGYNPIVELKTEAGRELQEIDLWEVSLVVSGACPGCLIQKEEPRDGTRHLDLHSSALPGPGF